MRRSLVRLATAAMCLLPVVLIGACASTPTNGTLVGHLRQVGGPPPGVDRPVAGTVTISGATATKQLTVGDDGNYSVDLPPGDYVVLGHSPTTMNGSKQQDCPATGPAVVSSGTVTAADAICSIR